MEGPVYMCDYLGYKTLNKPVTNISGLQGTLKDLYFHFFRNIQQGGHPQKSSVKVTPKGLSVTMHENSGPVDIFFDISDINQIYATRFATLKGSEKKPKAVFTPLEGSGPAPVNLDKSAFNVDKSFHFVLHSHHPPLLVCVLRRPKGVKALDCYVFSMDTPDSVLHVQSLVHQLTTPGGPAPGDASFQRGGSRGDFVRTEFGGYNMYRGPDQGQKIELKDEFFRGGGGGEGFPPQLDPGPRSVGQPSPRETYPAESGERPRLGWSYDKPQSGEEYKRVSGGQYYEQSTRPLSGDLRHATQFPDARPGNQYPPEGHPGNQYPPDGRLGNQYAPDSRQGNQYPPDGRPGNQYIPDSRQGYQYPPDSRQGNQYYPGNQYPVEHRPGDLGDDRSGVRAGSGYEQGYRRGEYERSEISHVRERSGDSGDNRVTGLSRKVSTGSDHSSGRGRRYEEGGGRGPHPDARFHPVSPRVEAPPKVMEKPLSPIRTGPAPGFPLGPGHAPLSPRQNVESPRSPVSHYPPAGPPPSSAGPYQEEPAYSLSNRESRNDAADPEPQSQGKPVAKVPPHLKGVKVLPSDFRAVKLKPKQQRMDSEESEHGYDNHKDILTQYKQLQEQEAEHNFKRLDDRHLDRSIKTRSYTSNWNDDTTPTSDYNRYPGDDDRRYIEQYSSQDTIQTRPPVRNDSHKDRHHSSPEYDQGSAGDWRSKPMYEVGGGQGGYIPRVGGGGGGGQPPSSAANDKHQMGRKKDAEIASMFTNFHVQDRQEPFIPDRNNFEESLGYLP